MFAASCFAVRPFAAGPRLPRAFLVSAVNGEFGWAAWSYSRQAKLNAWSWSGIGNIGNVISWATLGSAVYLRGESDDRVYIAQPNTFLAAGDTNSESSSVEAWTQWLDFGKPGKRKSLSGIDFDGQHVVAIEVYVSAGGDRAGVLAESLAIDSAQNGWTYSGETLPLSSDGTEFKLRFVGDGNQEVQVNRMTIYFDEVAS